MVCSITDFLYFCIRIGATLSKTYEKKKKRYAYLVLENVGNFQIRCKDSIVVLTLIAWAAIVTSASMVSYDLQVKSVAYSSRFLSCKPKNIMICVYRNRF